MIDRIWLDPGCQSDADYHIDRCWHSIRPDDCEECGTEPDEYISRPETDRLIAEAVAAERERCAEMFDEMALNETARSSQFRGGSDPWFNHTQLAKAHSAAAAAIRGQS